MLPKLKEYKPTGSNVLIEIINPEEMVETKIELVGSAAGSLAEGFGAPQGYILALGPGVKPEDWGFDVGNRIAFSDKLTPLPQVGLKGESDDNLTASGKVKRARGLISPSGVKAVLVESKCCGGGSCRSE